MADLVLEGDRAAAAEERVSVASNWRLVWWRFRKHRLAVASAVVLLALYAVVACPEFFSTYDPEATDARLAFIPAQRVRLFDGGRLSP
jgi:peptide/nickel transport system permease protein